VLAGELDGIRDIGGVLAAHDHRRPLVDHPVVDLADLVVADFLRREHLTRDRRPQLVNRLLRNHTTRHDCLLEPQPTLWVQRAFIVRPISLSGQSRC
jgi:hypothetical protein